MSSGNNMIPPDLLTVLCGISTKIPTYVISSKDLEFLRDKTQFARVISTLMGMEFTRLTPPVNHECLSNHVTNMITEYQLVDAGRIAKNSRTLDQIVQEVSSEFQGLTIGRKFTYMDHKLAGVTLDYRHIGKWEQYKTNIEPQLKKKIERIINSPASDGLFLQTFSDHPFIEVYAIECNKGKAMDTISRLISNAGGKILYLGDSESDNPAFQKADLSIGIHSDRRINTKLNSDYLLEFNELRPFLQKLENEDFIFDRMSQNLT
jgi:hydroxymethylpyrimidine pyrophosphatase-like HAD family hydrolase